MTKHAKITLSGARDIPFSALMLSQANVRRVKAGVSIDGLAADIERRGLLQSLTVRAQRDEEGNETGRRSEEHTSELQSLMRISYAVFCLKKKNTINQQQLTSSSSIQ